METVTIVPRLQPFQYLDLPLEETIISEQPELVESISPIISDTEPEMRHSSSDIHDQEANSADRLSPASPEDNQGGFCGVIE